ncbi:MAG: GGDEF domain-containing protein, partial [Carnobacterium sp.]
ISIISMMSYVVIKLIPNQKDFTLSKRQKTMILLFAGFASLLLMLFSVNLSGSIKVDLRHIIIILLIYYFGPSYSIPITVLISILRLYWGINTASILSAITYIVIGILIPIVYKHLPTYFNKYMTLLLFNTIFVVASGFNIFYITHNYILSLLVSLLFMLTSSAVLMLDTLFIEDMIRGRYMYLNEKEYATLDFLTGLLNMREFNKQWQIIQMNQNISNTAFLILDIDYFKTINDTHGHANGNLVLQQLAIILRINAPENQHIYRVGGEEFCLILNDLTPNELDQIAEKIREDVASKPFQLEDGKVVEVTVSIGVASTKNKDLKNLFRLADRCLYLAKDQGRNRVVIQAL